MRKQLLNKKKKIRKRLATSTFFFLKILFEKTRLKGREPLIFVVERTLLEEYEGKCYAIVRVDRRDAPKAVLLTRIRVSKRVFPSQFILQLCAFEMPLHADGDWRALAAHAFTFFPLGVVLWASVTKRFLAWFDDRVTQWRASETVTES